MRQTCLNMVYDLARRDERVVFVGSDLSPGLLADMKRDMPERWYMEGITEQNPDRDVGRSGEGRLHSLCQHHRNFHYPPVLRAGCGRSVPAIICRCG